jgi:hypothetical protein
MSNAPPLNVLISLHRGYGLGDAVQMSSVLRHVAKYRQNWRADLVAEAGRFCIGRGIVDNCFEFGKSPHPDKVYDAEVEILLYDTWSNFHDKPNTRVSSCLFERFGMAWDEALCRYQINVRPEVTEVVKYRWSTFVPQSHYRDLNKRVVALHYRGDSSPLKKDLSHQQADVICDCILRLGCVPLIIDWRDTSPLANRGGCGTTGQAPWSREWGRDAEYNCAVIRECAAFIGIDSGPSKCASSTDVPSLVVWTGHHPAPFHDPAPNTTHLVPHGYNGLQPVCDDSAVIEWFESHYAVRHYQEDPCREACRWLEAVLCGV